MADTNLTWYKDAIFYEVYIRAFNDGNGDGHGDLIGLTEKLDYFKELGVDCLWLSPMYPSPLRDDGYDISDYYNIHPDYGTLDDFKKLIAEAKQRGIRIITDLVMNHTSDLHPWFQESRSSKDNPKRDWYVWSDTDDLYTETRIIFLDTEPSNWTYDEVAGQYFWHRFYRTQPDLNWDNPEVIEEFKNIARFWLDLGLDGFRADAVPYLIERDHTSNENLPETHEILKDFRAFMDEEFPGTILLGEANMWPWDLRPYFANGDEFQMCFHFPVMPRLFMAVKKGEVSDVIDIMQRTPDIPANCQWCTFLRNHDELTLEMVTEEDRQWMWEQYAPEERMRLNLGIRRRMAPLLDNDRRKLELLNVVLFSLPGSPILYYGDEIGMGDNIWLFDRNGVRTPMQWEDAPNAGFSAAKETYAPVIDDANYGYSKVNVDNALADEHSLWHWTKQLIAMRKEHPAFSRGSYEFIETDNPAVLALLRKSEEETILALANFSDQEQVAKIPLPDYAAHEKIELFSQIPHGCKEEVHRTLLEPYEYQWLLMKE
ncbi:MAG: maltose alpha-D-glucosyltransferase [Anaerolineae bacterium]|jgi:maltose alpha-D-glucosyltransferase/alpha-amylase|nr:maltose alpha-D-glucosyltransferase [Anaerolineae bacterium]